MPAGAPVVGVDVVKEGAGVGANGSNGGVAVLLAGEPFDATGASVLLKGSKIVALREDVSLDSDWVDGRSFVVVLIALPSASRFCAMSRMASVLSSHRS